MVNWKTLSAEQLGILGIFDYDGEVILVDPTAHPSSSLFIMFSAEKIFSEKQLGRYKKVTPSEFIEVEAKFLKRENLNEDEEE